MVRAEEHARASPVGKQREQAPALHRRRSASKVAIRTRCGNLRFGWKALYFNRLRELLACLHADWRRGFQAMRWGGFVGGALSRGDHGVWANASRHSKYRKLQRERSSGD